MSHHATPLSRSPALSALLLAVGLGRLHGVHLRLRGPADDAARSSAVTDHDPSVPDGLGPDFFGMHDSDPVGGIAAGQRVLDVGCGPGALTMELVTRVGADSVVAIDPSETFVEALGPARDPGG